MKKLFLVGGGTGGHCIPINVVYSEAPKNFKCFILTDNRGKKYFDNIDSNNVIILKNLISSQSRLANIINSPFLFIQSILYNFKIKPDYTLGFGGFIFGPVVVGYLAEFISLTFNMYLLSVIWGFNGLALFYLIKRNKNLKT